MDDTSPQVPEHNRTGQNLRAPMPRPKVRGKVIDFHCHLLSAAHASAWFAAADHYGIDTFFTMGPLEEAIRLKRVWGERIHFNAVPAWRDIGTTGWVDDWLRRLDGFYNIGTRIAKFHMAPGTLARANMTFDSPIFHRVLKAVLDRRMIIMSHVGDPELWYQSKYADTAKFGTRDLHYQLFAEAIESVDGNPWVGAHLGGNPEDLPRLQGLLDRFPNLWLDCSATRWMQREVCCRRDAMREFFIRNQDRILFGSDQVSGDDRGFDFYASRFWVHRKLWETAFVGDSPITDPDLPEMQQPTLRGLCLPDPVLQKLYRNNAVRLMASVGVDI
ncbi:MAG TPA: amidohydrolase family protein [Tepidisphaeraceae bacterium]|nr:amidohydrolase family protein [Tepidisphaeraceae bacterium]